MTRLILLTAACLLVLEGDSALNALVAGRLSGLDTSLDAALLVLSLAQLITLRPCLHRRSAAGLCQMGLHASLIFLPLTLGRVWCAAVGFLAGYLGPLAAHRARCAAHRARCAARRCLGEREHHAVAAERHRIARDLHDLVGHDLSVITLRSELALRKAPAQAEPVRRELAEVIKTSRQALRDVRRIAHGGLVTRLATTADSLRPLLDSAGVPATVRVDCGPLPPAVDDALSMVLREAVTNLLKHSRCRTCRIEAVREDGRVRLTVANDGVPRSTRGAVSGRGAGMANLTARVGAVGGTFTAGFRPGGWFLVTAEIPARPLIPAPRQEEQAQRRPVDSGHPAS